MKKLILFGLGDLARIATEYFTHDSDYEVAGFTVDGAYANVETLCGLPVFPFEDVECVFPPCDYDIHICLVYNNLNRIREHKCKEAKAKGYRLASYVSSRAFVAKSAKMGEHNFIMEGNVIQPFTQIGDGNIFWSGNHYGHDTIMGNYNFISSHVVISGHCNIGSNCFFGVNSTLANGTRIGSETWVSHASVLQGSVPKHSMVKNNSFTELNEEALQRALDRARV